MSEEFVIKIEHLSKIYKIFDKPIDRVKEAFHPFAKRYSKDFFALDDISLIIKKGETVGIIGKNGAGKSTLLKLITGVLTPTAGNIQVNGRVASLLELGAGFNPEMTGLENIFLSGTLLGLSKNEIKSLVPKILSFADIGDFIYQPVKMYSSGMFARLAFSVNINLKPEILIVDEALAVGDEFFQQKCIQKMKDMHKEGITIIFVSHSIAAIKALCDRCILLDKGRKTSDGMASKVCDLYQNKTTFIDELSEKVSHKYIEESVNDNSFYRNDLDFLNRITERSGSYEMQFTAFDFYDEHGNIVVSQEIGGEIHMVISGITKVNIPAGTAIGILCRNSFGNDIFIGNLNLYNIYLPKISKDKRFTLSIKYDVPLSSGIYFFGLGAKPDINGDYFYDRLFNAAKLEIYQKDSSNGNFGGCVLAKLKSFNIDVF